MSFKRFAVVNFNTGEIVNTGGCADTDFAAQIGNWSPLSFEVREIADADGIIASWSHKFVPGSGKAGAGQKGSYVPIPHHSNQLGSGVYKAFTALPAPGGPGGTG